MKRKTFTQPLLEQRPPASGRVEIRDSLSPLILRITAAGNRAFVVRARIKGETQPIRLTFPAPAHISALEAARAWAVASVSQCRRGEDPRRLVADADQAERTEAERRQRNAFDAVADRFLEKHASKNRSYKETRRIIDFYLRPTWRRRQIGEVGRSDIVALLDQIEAGAFKAEDGKLYGGPVMADRVLAQVRKLMNWHAARDPDFVSPIVKGMARTKPKERARLRVLSDDEIRLIFPALRGTHGGVLKVLFYTGQRLGEVAQMRRSQIDAEGVWAIPAEVYKAKRPQFVPLTSGALAALADQPQIDGGDLVFPAERSAKKQIANWSDLKAELDAAVKKANSGNPLPHWTTHDIRRTCRTLMARAGVRPDIAERVLGHAIAGVEGVYDRHAYLAEKKQALEALEALLGRILHPAPANVVPLLRSAAE